MGAAVHRRRCRCRHRPRRARGRRSTCLRRWPAPPRRCHSHSAATSSPLLLPMSPLLTGLPCRSLARWGGRRRVCRQQQAPPRCLWHPEGGVIQRRQRQRQRRLSHRQPWKREARNRKKELPQSWSGTCRRVRRSRCCAMSWTGRASQTFTTLCTCPALLRSVNARAMPSSTLSPLLRQPPSPARGSTAGASGPGQISRHRR
mmetsp:Transcript_144112/g.359281  ORF Transcript_144112/g.359281 Transcript_144112/m.359281 type:complete len:202 (+) Transcript_144112:649-1254(+)